MILNILFDYFLKEAQKETISELRVGLGYTAVKIDSGQVGLAYTLYNRDTTCCAIVEKAGTLAGSRADIITRLILSESSI